MALISRQSLLAPSTSACIAPVVSCMMGFMSGTERNVYVGGRIKS
jgi:anaerobic C4-dicarboxylate transporter